MARSESQTVHLQVRIREDLRQHLEQSAKSRHVSLNAEIVDRLEYVRGRTSLLGEVLSLSYGKEVAGMLMLIGAAMTFADCVQHVKSGAARDWKWGTDPDAYEAALQAALTVLDEARPEGPYSDESASVGIEMAYALIKAVRGDPDAPKNPFTEDAPKIRALLGPTVFHVRGSEPATEVHRDSTTGVPFKIRPLKIGKGQPDQTTEGKGSARPPHGKASKPRAGDRA